MKPIRILSYNIHKGVSTLRRRQTLTAIRESIRTVGAEIVFLQEVTGDDDGDPEERKAVESQLEFLADEVWSHYSYGKNAVYENGHHGNAILSKFPIVHTKNTDVSAHRFEKRGILFARLHVPEIEQTVDCYCLHFGLGRRGRIKQLEQLCQKVAANSADERQLIIAGDFNDWDQRACEILESSLGVKEVYRDKHKRYARSYPSRIPLLPLDRIYVRGLKVESAKVLNGAPWTGISDHSPIFAEVVLR